jgi:hypothetical protein
MTSAQLNLGGPKLYVMGPKVDFASLEEPFLNRPLCAEKDRLYFLNFLA